MNAVCQIITIVSKISGIPEKELTATTMLYGSGIVSSLMLLEIMAVVEKEHHLYIKPEELIEDNFSDIAKLAAFVERKVKREARHIDGTH